VRGLEEAEGRLRAVSEGVRSLRSFSAPVTELGASEAGNTNISLALSAALDQHDVETIFFLTDGMPTEGILIPKEIVKRTTEKNLDRRRPARIFTIAPCIPEAAKFLSNLADWNEGEYKLVTEVREK